MSFLWIKATSDDENDLDQTPQGVEFPDPRSSPVHSALLHPRTAVIVAIRNLGDEARAFQLIEQLAGIQPLWVYQPAATVGSTVAFIKAGASSVLTTISDVDDAIRSSKMSKPCEIGSHKSLLGGSSSMQSVSSAIELVAHRRCNVLIEGETGTGKEVVAREIHRSGNRSRGPWIAVNCGAIPDALLEAELFGHVKGAFTGAVQGRIGKFEAADHGTIFLDEIGDMPFAVQAKLLRVLQEREVERLGGNEKIRLDVRVIAATNVDLSERVKAGLFRQDLYYRLNVFQIALPPLRERMGDVAVLARHFASKVCRNEGLRSKTLDTSTIDQLMRHDWPGNVRELENVIEMSVVMSGSRSNILPSDMRISPAASRQSPRESTGQVLLPPGGLDYQQALEAFEHNLLTQALARTRGNKTAAAELLCLKRTTLAARMRVLETRLPRLAA